MFRGRLVDCHEVPDRLRYVLDELQCRPVGQLLTPDAALDVDAAMARVHAPDYLAFLVRAWDDWVALDPTNAERDALPSVWPLASKHAFRTDAPPLNFAARLGQYAFDSGTPLKKRMSVKKSAPLTISMSIIYATFLAKKDANEEF